MNMSGRDEEVFGGYSNGKKETTLKPGKRERLAATSGIREASDTGSQETILTTDNGGMSVDRSAISRKLERMKRDNDELTAENNLLCRQLYLAKHNASLRVVTILTEVLNWLDIKGDSTYGEWTQLSTPLTSGGAFTASSPDHPVEVRGPGVDYNDLFVSTSPGTPRSPGVERNVTADDREAPLMAEESLPYSSVPFVDDPHISFSSTEKRKETITRTPSSESRKTYTKHERSVSPAPSPRIPSPLRLRDPDSSDKAFSPVQYAKTPYPNKRSHESIRSKTPDESSKTRSSKSSGRRSKSRGGGKEDRSRGSSRGSHSGRKSSHSGRKSPHRDDSKSLRKESRSYREEYRSPSYEKKSLRETSRSRRSFREEYIDPEEERRMRQKRRDEYRPPKDKRSHRESSPRRVTYSPHEESRSGRYSSPADERRSHREESISRREEYRSPSVERRSRLEETISREYRSPSAENKSRREDFYSTRKDFVSPIADRRPRSESRSHREEYISENGKTIHKVESVTSYEEEYVSPRGNYRRREESTQREEKRSQWDGSKVEESPQNKEPKRQEDRSTLRVNQKGKQDLSGQETKDGSQSPREEPKASSSTKTPQTKNDDTGQGQNWSQSAKLPKSSPQSVKQAKKESPVVTRRDVTLAIQELAAPERESIAWDASCSRTEKRTFISKDKGRMQIEDRKLERTTTKRDGSRTRSEEQKTYTKDILNRDPVYYLDEVYTSPRRRHAASMSRSNRELEQAYFSSRARSPSPIIHPPHSPPTRDRYSPPKFTEIARHTGDLSAGKSQSNRDSFLTTRKESDTYDDGINIIYQDNYSEQGKDEDIDAHGVSSREYSLNRTERRTNPSSTLRTMIPPSLMESGMPFTAKAIHPKKLAQGLDSAQRISPRRLFADDLAEAEDMVPEDLEIGYMPTPATSSRSKSPPRGILSPPKSSRVSPPPRSPGIPPPPPPPPPPPYDPAMELSFGMNTLDSDELSQHTITSAGSSRKHVPSGTSARRLIGEIAFQLDRRILNYVFAAGLQENQHQDRRRFYGYIIQNIPDKIMRESVNKYTGKVDHQKRSDLQFRYEYILNKLAPLGYDVNVHSELSMDLVNKYGLLPLPSRNKGVEGISPEAKNAIRDMVMVEAPIEEQADIAILLDCLASMAENDGRPMLMFS